MTREREDRFVAMVNAKAETDLRLHDFAPRTMLAVPHHEVPRARYPAIDFHNHLDAMDPTAVLRVMDACNIERIVNITMRVGNEALEIMRRFHMAAPGRLSTVAWMDWSDLHVPGFFDRTVARLEEFV